MAARKAANGDAALIAELRRELDEARDERDGYRYRLDALLDKRGGSVAELTDEVRALLVDLHHEIGPQWMSIGLRLRIERLEIVCDLHTTVLT